MPLKYACIILLFGTLPLLAQKWELPLAYTNRASMSEIELTHIGHFGLWRKDRPTVPGHFHTAVDLKRTDKTYKDEPIYAIGAGRVISMRNDGPYAQIIIEHTDSLYSVYEHLAGIQVTPGDKVTSKTILGRFMTRSELDRYGWQFDHLHLEIMKRKPRARKPVTGQPHLKFRTYALVCFTPEQLTDIYHDPLQFFSSQWANKAKSHSAP